MSARSPTAGAAMEARHSRRKMDAQKNQA